jgi:hypothetical protein
MNKQIFNLDDKTRVWAVRFVLLPMADFMAMVFQESGDPRPMLRYRFRYYDAGPGFDAPDTKRVFDVRDDKDDTARLVEALGACVRELEGRTATYEFDADGAIGTSAMKAVMWIKKQKWSSAKKVGAG